VDVLLQFALHRWLKPLVGKFFSDYRLAGFDSRQAARLMIRACVWSAAHPIGPSPVNPTLPTILRQTPSPKRAQPRRAYRRFAAAALVATIALVSAVAGHCRRVSRKQIDSTACAATDDEDGVNFSPYK
jgi:hypothetical protein